MGPRGYSCMFGVSIAVEMSNTYSALPGPSTPPRHLDTHAIRLDDSPRASRRSLESDSDESDIIYRDALDIEPFDEKRDARYKDERIMRDGIEGDEEGGQGYIIEPSRVSLIGIPVLRSWGLIAGNSYVRGNGPREYWRFS